MTNSFLQIVPVVVARCCSIFLHAPSSHSLYLLRCAAPRGSPCCRLPRNLCNSDPAGKTLGWLAITFDTSLPSDHQQHKLRLAGFVDIKQSRSIVCWFSLRQMTIIHQVLKWLARLAQPRFRTNQRMSAIFLSQELTVLRATPKVRVKPRRLLRSW